LNPQHSLRGTVGAPDRQAVGGLGGDDPGNRATVVGHSDVAFELRFDLAVRVQDVKQHGVDALIANGIEVRADLRADAFQLVAG
jgi:hypothetical protein